MKPIMICLTMWIAAILLTGLAFDAQATADNTPALEICVRWSVHLAGIAWQFFSIIYLMGIVAVKIRDIED